jgi:asparagine synthase (glutamine-hydrolysing)
MDEKAPPSDEELSYLISDAVSIRMRSDVSIGTYLSGGLDSTILTYLSKPNDTWTVGFEQLNEFNWSDIADKNLKSLHHKIIIDRNQFLDLSSSMVTKRMEPLSVPNEVLIYLMTKEVKKKNTVVLSGEGADELFMGYDRIFRWANTQGVLNLSEFDEKYCYGTNKDDEVLDFALEDLKGKKVLDKIAYYFQITHLQGLLRRLDNATMLCSVEARVPFVDHRLIERLAGVSFEYKMGNSFKEPLKRIFRPMIPKEIIERKKIGFPVPLDTIFENYLPSQKQTSMDKWLLYNMENFYKTIR